MNVVETWRVAVFIISAAVVTAIVVFMYRYITTLTVMKTKFAAEGSTLVAPPKYETLAYHAFFAAYIAVNCVGTLQRLDQHAPATLALWPSPFILLGLLYFLSKFYRKYTAILREYQ